MKFWQWKCPCPKTECLRHGNHKECKKHHAQENSLPFCKGGKDVPGDDERHTNIANRER